ncbi:hypothetical protein A9A59_2074 [Tepidiforma thermophila]|uniref:Uncharacterized protein n=1 Tax=Tepidiforma thermophila (strain KCTC 52669 / CGMCC 1.13589 / G233) TaxID=2761530 RepID=A0A2A9HI93_TEPT2|nr:hypothetical protein A9A59_2074 [Tepidiforma thermophila]
MNVRLPSFLFAILLAAGAAMGAFSPRPDAGATTAATIYIYAGVDYGNAYLTCGWHLDCSASPIAKERGLDFIATSDPYWTARAFFHGWGFNTTASPTFIGYMLIGNDPAPGNSNCPATSVKIHNQSAYPKSGMYYIHSSAINSGSWYTLYGRNFSSGGYWNTRHVGNFAQTGSCPSAPHIMTWYASLDGTYNVLPRDPWYNCPLAAPVFPCTTATYQQLPRDLSDWIYVTQYSNP